MGHNGVLCAIALGEKQMGGSDGHQFPSACL